MGGAYKIFRNFGERTFEIIRCTFSTSMGMTGIGTRTNLSADWFTPWADFWAASRSEKVSR